LINDKSYKGYKTNIEAGLIDLREKVSVGLNDLKNEIESLYSIEDIGYSGDDLISDLVNSVYAKCNANKYNIHEKIFMSIIADQRIKLNLRPGLTDLKKEGFRKYSDIFIWLDLIKISKDYDEVVFIENEIKKDWWENDSYKEPADNIVREWEDLFDEKKTLTMIRLDALLISQAEAYLDGDAQLEITRLASEFLKSIKTKSMFLNLPVNDRLGDFAPNDIDFILLGEELNGGNIDEIEVLEMLEPETLTNDVRFQYDSTTRTLFAETQVKVPYIVNVINSFGRYSTPEYYHGTVYITFNCEFEFYLITNNDLEYYLNSVRYDIHKTSVDINELKASNVYDD